MSSHFWAKVVKKTRYAFFTLPACQLEVTVSKGRATCGRKPASRKIDCISEEVLGGEPRSQGFLGQRLGLPGSSRQWRHRQQVHFRWERKAGGPRPPRERASSPEGQGECHLSFRCSSMCTFCYPPHPVSCMRQSLEWHRGAGPCLGYSSLRERSGLQELELEVISRIAPGQQGSVGGHVSHWDVPPLC